MDPGTTPQSWVQTNMAVQDGNPVTFEVEAEGSRVQSQVLAI